MKIVWVSLWYLSASVEPTIIIQYNVDKGDPEIRCQMTKDFIVESLSRVTAFSGSWSKDDLVCVPAYVEDGKQ